MRDYGKVYSTFWSSQTTGGMSDDAKLLALYLVTCSHSTIAGVFRLPDGYVSEDLGWGSERVRKGFHELFEKGFSYRCETTKWVWVLKHLEWNKPENPNQRKSAAKIACSVPDDCAWKPDFMRVCGPLLEISWSPPVNPSVTVAKPLLNQEQEQEQEQEQKQDLELEQNQEQDISAAVADATTPAAAKPIKARPKAKTAKPAEPAPSSVTWQAYADAYEAKYGAVPVRNAAVNGQLAQIVARLGAAEAPQVAAFFLGHKNLLYVRAMHPVTLLLRDAEKLRTEWATGQQVTHAQATMADRTQTNLSAFAPLIAEARAKEQAHGVR